MREGNNGKRAKYFSCSLTTSQGLTTAGPRYSYENLQGDRSFVPSPWQANRARRRRAVRVRPRARNGSRGMGSASERLQHA
jgi:hypothetical protein